MDDNDRHDVRSATAAPLATAVRPTPRAAFVALSALLAISVACGKTPSPGAQSGERSATAVDTSGSTHENDATPRAPAASNRVTLGEAAFATAGIRVAPVEVLPADDRGVGLSVPGQVELDPRRIALVSARIAGRIERLTAVEGDRVTEGETVAYLYSPEFLTAQVDLAQAERRVRVLAGTPDDSGARALAEAARRRLRLMGASDAEVTRAAGEGDPAAVLALRAPLSGSIMQTHLLPGSAVEPGAPIFTVADLSVIDVVAEVPERSLPLVRTGQRARVSIAAFPHLRFAGAVERLRDALNPETRTVRAVIHVPNGSHRLRPGMFATVQLDVSVRDAVDVGGTPAGSTPREVGAVLTIPETAVVTDGERRFVFVEVGVRSYERREVRVASLAPAGSTMSQATRVLVQDGLRVGERVVVSGAFTLKSELAKASLSEEEH
jgi:RND family efflux transporter MFP subunit